MIGALILIGAGCNQSEGAVEVDVGTAPLAAAYRIDLYADEPGLDVVEGVYLTSERVATLDDIPAGKWALLIQAQNGDLTTIGHYQARIEVRADQTTKITAGAYRPGMPGDPLPETEASLSSFGPDGDALFTSLYAARMDSLPAASVDVELTDGEPDDAENVNLSVLNRSVSGAPRCGTSFLSEYDREQAAKVTRQASVNAQVGTVNPGESKDFFVLTTFRTVSCRRLLNDSQTRHCLIFAEVVGGTPVISEATALAVASGFDSDNPFQDGDNGIYNDTRERFGSEWAEGGGRDGDSRVILLFLSSDSIGGTGLFGFFNPADQTESGNSNRGEILYLNADRANADLYDVLGTIAHEFTHLIVYNQKVAQNGTFPADAQAENSVLDEGLAVLNEELSGFALSGPEGGNAFLLTALSNLLKDGLNRRYFHFSGQVSDYGAGYLFWRYAHDQLGQDKLKTLVTSTQTGRANFDSVLEEPFPSFFQKYTQAVALNGQADLPTELQFTNLDLFGDYRARDNTIFDLNGLQGINNVTLPGTLNSTVELEPWGTVFYRAAGGSGAPVQWRAAGADGLSVGLVPLKNAK